MMSAFFRWAHSSGLTSTDLWAPVAEFVSRPADMRISERMVPSVGQVIDLADATGRLPGGERYRVPVLAAGLLGPRPEELFVVEGSEFHIASEPVNGVNDLGPYVEFSCSEPVVSAKDSPDGTNRERRQLKARRPGDVRRVPVWDAILPDVMEHLERYCHGGLFVSEPDGGPIRDRARWANQYYKPSVASVLGTASNPTLRTLPFSWLRKAAINWWLGIMPLHQAAELAGHSPETLLRYYAAATSGAWTDMRVAAQTSLAARTPAKLSVCKFDPVGNR